MDSRSLGLTLVCLAALAQTPAPAPPTAPAPVFSVTSTLVQVDAVVTDSKGRHITDLRPEEFEIYEDGKLQPLTHFSLVRLPARESSPAPRRAEKKSPADLPPAPAAPLRLEDVRRTVVLMVDDLGLSFESMVAVRAALHTYIEKDVQPGDLVAICRTGNGSSALRQFTSDKRVLLAIADGLNWNPNGRSRVNLFDAIGKYGASGGVNPSGNYATRDAAYDIERNAEFTLGTLGAVSAVTSGVRNLPGRKSIVLFSDGIRLVPSTP